MNVNIKTFLEAVGIDINQSQKAQQLIESDFKKRSGNPTIEKLFALAGLEKIFPYMGGIIGLTYEQVTDDFDPGTNVWDREDVYNIHLVKFVDWAANVHSSFENGDDFE